MQLSAVYFSRILLLYTFLFKKKLAIVNPSPMSPYLPCPPQIHTGICDTPAYETHWHM